MIINYVFKNKNNGKRKVAMKVQNNFFKDKQMAPICLSEREENVEHIEF